MAWAVPVSLFLFAQPGHFVNFLVVHNFQHVLGRMGTQILDLDFIGIKSSLRDAWGLLDFLQDDHEVLDVAVQEIEGFIDWKSHGRWILSAAVVACIRSVRDGWQANRTSDMKTAQYPLPANK